MLSVSSGIVHPYYVSALGPGRRGDGRRRRRGVRRARRGAARVRGAARPRPSRSRRDRRDRAARARAPLPALAAGRRRVVVGRGARARRALAPAASRAPRGRGRRSPRCSWCPAIYSRDGLAGARRRHLPGRPGPTSRTTSTPTASRPTTSTPTGRCSPTCGPREPGSRWDVLTQGANTAAALILLGGRAAALGGYGTIDPVLTPAALARLVAQRRGPLRRARRRLRLARGQRRVGRGRATPAATVPPRAWRKPAQLRHRRRTPILAYPHGGWNLVLYDCAGRDARARGDA